MAASSCGSNAIETEDRYCVVEPLGEHKATIVWLHDMHKDSSSSLSIVRSLNVPNVKWICLDSGTHIHVFATGCGLPRTSWCNVGMTSVTTQDSLAELDSAAVRVAKILSKEPPNVIKGVGGVGQGAQVALHFAKWNAIGDHIENIRIVIGINSWRIPNNRIINGAPTRASGQSILIIRGNREPKIPFYIAKETAESLIDDKFGEVSFVQLRRFGIEITSSVLNTVHVWLNGKLQFDQYFNLF